MLWMRFDEHLIGSRKCAPGAVREHTRKKHINGIPAVRVVHEFVEGMEGAAEHDDDGDWYGHGVDPPSSVAADQALMHLEKFVLLGVNNNEFHKTFRGRGGRRDIYSSRFCSISEQLKLWYYCRRRLVPRTATGYFTPPPSPTQKREGQARKL